MGGVNPYIRPVEIEKATRVFHVTFRNEEGLAKYLKHPAHLDYVKVVSGRREKVIVFDYWADE